LNLNIGFHDVNFLVQQLKFSNQAKFLNSQKFSLN